MTSKQLKPEETLKFLYAGKAIFTVRSERTGVRYTYRVSRAKDSGKELWFVSLLTGPANTSDYTYIGVITANKFRLTSKSKFTADAAPVKAFVWVLTGLTTNTLHSVEIWHEGRCGRCARELTVPESIEAGYGPECINLMGGPKPKAAATQEELGFMSSVRSEVALCQ